MQANMTQKRQRTGRYSNGSSSVEQRHRSFRERRTQRMRELEEQVSYLSMGQDERNARLVSENRALRGFVMQTKHQVSRIGLLLKELNDSLVEFTTDQGEPGSHRDPENQNGDDSACSRSQSRQCSQTSAECETRATRPEFELESSDPAATHDSTSPDFFPEAAQFASIVDANASGATGDPVEGDCGPGSFHTDIRFHVADSDPCDDILPGLPMEDLEEFILAPIDLPQLSPTQPSRASTNLMGRYSNQGDELDAFLSNDTRGRFSELDMSLSSRHSQQQPGMQSIMQPTPPLLTADSLSGCIDLMEFSIQSVLYKFMGKPHEAL
ncbi:hypothetical protein QQZ08_000355 [Neonectria magnoliae]|uniref:BZIP domain-containing protein n=1 Tax=Neonectria magnoliae TaxID=2732573 RepID=A0ABR1IHT4_9HYPO